MSEKRKRQLTKLYNSRTFQAGLILQLEQHRVGGIRVGQNKYRLHIYDNLISFLLTIYNFQAHIIFVSVNGLQQIHLNINF